MRLSDVLELLVLVGGLLSITLFGYVMQALLS